MKKTLAFILVCALLVSAFALTAFAENVVGTHDQNNNVTDGVNDANFGTGKGTTQTVGVSVSATNHRYAVDVTYSTPEYTLPTLTWNVDTLMYDKTEHNLDQKVTITVTNYSDLSVGAAVDVDEKDPSDGLNLTFDATNLTVDAVVGTIDVAGTAQTKTFTGSLTAMTDETLKQVVDYYTIGAGAAAVSAGKVTLATYTVTISK